MNVSESMDGYLYSNYFLLQINTLLLHFDMVSKLLLFVEGDLRLLLLPSLIIQMAESHKWMYHHTLSVLDVVALYNRFLMLLITFHLDCMIITLGLVIHVFMIAIALFYVIITITLHLFVCV